MKKLFIHGALTYIILLLIGSCSQFKNTDPVEELIGTWEVSEKYTIPDWGTLDDSYTIRITKSPTDENTILITNFGNIDETITAKVQGSSIIISSQSINWDGDLITVSGSESDAGNALTYCYNIPEYWTATCTATKL
jgi:hypothetical protein